MKDKLTRFLKDHKAWDEFQTELKKATKGASLDSVFHLLKSSNSFDVALADGVVLDYHTDLTDIDWKELNMEWVKLLKDEELS